MLLDMCFFLLKMALKSLRRRMGCGFQEFAIETVQLGVLSASHTMEIELGKVDSFK
jgi:hypothetical protein